MWQRTKRLINSYLDNMIEKTSSPDSDIRALTRGEVARLNEYEVQSRASAKLFEKEIAEIELKILALAEREKIFRAEGNDKNADRATETIQALAAQRDLLKQQISEAKAAAEKAKALREERKVQGTELANDMYLTQMRENIASVNSGFGVNDPGSTIDEMRTRLSRTSIPSLDAQVAEADKELNALQSKAKVDDVLARYKNQLGGEPLQETRPPQSTQARTPETASTNRIPEEEERPQEKTLGRSDGSIRPID
jgi:DNA repair exonuclease SbcCD ATPase subunit